MHSINKPTRQPPQPSGWPAAPLTPQQLARRAAQERAMRAGLLARWPQGLR